MKKFIEKNNKFVKKNLSNASKKFFKKTTYRRYQKESEMKKKYVYVVAFDQKCRLDMLGISK